ncbi:hypothetical protein BH20VER1_BH20VER1_18860 [soil metagenome]
MFRLRDRLAVELEDERGMTGGGDIRVEILVAGDAGIRAHVETLQVTHTCTDANGVGPVRPGVAA